MHIPDSARSFCRCFLAFTLLCLPLVAQDSKGAGVSRDQVGFIRNFETALNKAISTTFSNPFGLVSKPKGVYLQGYGYTFQFLVNIRRGMIQTPFGAFANAAEITPEQKKQRIEQCKDELLHALLNAGSGPPGLKSNEYISIIAFFEEINPVSPEENVNKTMILSVLKSDLEKTGSLQNRFDDFKQRVKIIEY